MHGSRGSKHVVQWYLTWAPFEPAARPWRTQAREYLHFKLTGVQHTTPVALMTSEAKGNDGHVRRLLRELDWFGRGEQSFR